jgi:hypothetical protein
MVSIYFHLLKQQLMSAIVASALRTYFTFNKTLVSVIHPYGVEQTTGLKICSSSAFFFNQTVVGIQFCTYNSILHCPSQPLQVTRIHGYCK